MRTGGIGGVGSAARKILDGMEKDQLHIFVGRDSRMMNLLNRVAPRRSTHIIHKQMKRLLDWQAAPRATD